MQSNPLGRAFAALALAFLCTSPAFVAASAADFGKGRVVVAPINLGIDSTDELSSGLGPVWKEVLGHFKDTEDDRPIAALERESAEDLWRSVMAEARALDPEAGIHDVYARFAQAVASEFEYDVLVFPTLITRAARVSGEYAAWDGVQRGVSLPRVENAVDAGQSGLMTVSSYGGTGELAAASLHLAIFESGGDLHYEGTGGLTLLQEVVKGGGRKAGTFETRLRSEPFADLANLREGVGAALRKSGKSLPAAPAADAIDLADDRD